MLMYSLLFFFPPGVAGREKEIIKKKREKERERKRKRKRKKKREREGGGECFRR